MIIDFFIGVSLGVLLTGMIIGGVYFYLSRNKLVKKNKSKPLIP